MDEYEQLEAAVEACIDSDGEVRVYEEAKAKATGLRLQLAILHQLTLLNQTLTGAAVEDEFEVDPA